MSLAGSALVAGTLGSLGAGLATGVGALAIFGLAQPSRRQEDMTLGFAAGVMIAASFFSLIVPALDAAAAQGFGKAGVSSIVVGAVLSGAAGLSLLDRLLPSLDDLAPASGRMAGRNSRPIWLMIGAITLHNIPEGMAVGLSFSGGSVLDGVATATGIGVQNVPEGFAVSAALAALGYRTRTAFAGGLASGLVEPVAGAASAALVGLARPLLPWGLGLAAGAMIYIVVAQIVPQTVRDGEGRVGVASFMVGLGVMLFLDTALG